MWERDSPQLWLPLSCEPDGYHQRNKVLYLSNKEV
jgi:hypothetical protein